MVPGGDQVNQLVPDIVCVPVKWTSNPVFEDDGTADAVACSDPIPGEIGVKTNWMTRFTKSSTSAGSRLWGCFGKGCFTTVSKATVQSNLIGGQPTNSWEDIKTATDTIDIEWTYTFQYTGELIRVCFVSGVIGIVHGKVYSGLLM
jgi:hypothetical protein